MPNQDLLTTTIPEEAQEPLTQQSKRVAVESKDELLTKLALSLVSDLEELASKKLSKSEFANQFIALIVLYTKIPELNNPDIIKRLEDVFDKDKAGQRVPLRTIRRSLGCISEYNELISKADFLVEEAISKNKDIQTVTQSHSATEAPRMWVGKIATPPEQSSWYKKYGSYEQFCAWAQAGKIRDLQCFADSEIRRVSVLCQPNGHRPLCSLDSVSIAPHPIISKDSAEKLYATSHTRLSPQEQELARKYIDSSEWVKFDHLLRPGKKAEIHIINFLPVRSCYENIWSDATTEAFVTGASVHCFNYPGINNSEGKIEHKSDLVSAGIAMVNKLLDDGVHPDNIILQGYGNAVEIAREVHKQFSLTGEVDLTLFSPNGLQTLQHKHHEASPESFLQGKKSITEQLTILSERNKNDVCLRKLPAYFNLLNSLIKLWQETLETHEDLRNPPIPKQRVIDVRGDVRLVSLERQPAPTR